MADPSSQTALDLALAPPALEDRHDAARSEVLRLFDASRDGVYRYALSFGLAPSDAEDILQEVYLALFRHLARNGARRNLRGWVFRVTRNLSLKRRARQSRLDKVFVAPGSLRDPVDPAADPELQLAISERQVRLWAVVRALPERDRECLRLRAEGLRYREIADVIGVSLGTVAGSLARTFVKVGRADPDAS